MALETDTITLPVYWVSYLINGDASGMEDFDVAECDDYMKQNIYPKGWQVVGIVEGSERFTWSYGLYGGVCEGGDVMDYELLREVT